MAKMKNEYNILMERYENIDNVADIVNEADTCLYLIEQAIGRFEILLEYASPSVLHEAFQDDLDMIMLLQKISNIIVDYYEE